mmetsp:Transcript_15912/g.40425  ORF Transcript_15912/g.40425 Transcript_15912/m.40425 type:complete len:287 (-) Transcript_15912:707-1567(-)
MEQRRAAAGHDALLHRRKGRVLCVLDAQLAVLQLCLGGGTDLDDGNAASELGNALAELLNIVHAVAALELLLDLRHTHRDLLLAAGLRDDGGAGGRDCDLARRAQLLEHRILELHAQVFGDVLRAGHDCNVLQQCLPALAKAGRLDGDDLEVAAQLVDHQRGERLARNVLRDDHQRGARLGGLLQDRDDLACRLDLLVADQHAAVVKLALLALGVVHKLRRDVAAVDGHALLHLHQRLQRAARLDGQHAVRAHIVQRLCDHLTDGLVVASRDGGDGLDLVKAVHRP